MKWWQSGLSSWDEEPSRLATFTVWAEIIVYGGGLGLLIAWLT